MAIQVDKGIDPWFGALARLAHTGILLINADGKVEFASDLARDLFGCGEGTSLDDCIAPASEALNSTIEELKKEIAESGEGCNSTRRLQLSVNIHTTVHRLMLAVHLVDVDDCRGALVLVSDATEKEQLERDLRLASRFRNVGRLYQSMAHDLRTPVASVRLYASILRNMIEADNLDDAHTRKKMDCLDVVEDAVMTLSNSLQMLLDEISQDHPSQASEFDAGEVLSSAFKLIKPQAAKSDVAVELKVPEQSVKLPGNPDPFKHAILNLAVNAIEAMPYGGRLRLDMSCDGHTATIVVADTGSGIPRELKDLVFNRHYTTKTTGTGIGLHVTRETIENLGGAITFVSKENEGTTFRIELPVRVETRKDK